MEPIPNTMVHLYNKFIINQWDRYSSINHDVRGFDRADTISMTHQIFIFTHCSLHCEGLMSLASMGYTSRCIRSPLALHYATVRRQPSVAAPEVLHNITLTTGLRVPDISRHSHLFTLVGRPCHHIFHDTCRDPPHGDSALGTVVESVAFSLAFFLSHLFCEFSSMCNPPTSFLPVTNLYHTIGCLAVPIVQVCTLPLTLSMASRTDKPFFS